MYVRVDVLGHKTMTLNEPLEGNANKWLGTYKIPPNENNQNYVSVCLSNILGETRIFILEPHDKKSHWLKKEKEIIGKGL